MPNNNKLLWNKWLKILRTSGVSGPCSWDPWRLGASGLRVFSDARTCEWVFVSCAARWSAVLDLICPGNMVARWGWDCARLWFELVPTAREKRRESRDSTIWLGIMDARRIVSSGSPIRRSSSVMVNEGSPRLGYRGRTMQILISDKGPQIIRHFRVEFLCQLTLHTLDSSG